MVTGQDQALGLRKIHYFHGTNLFVVNVVIQKATMVG